MFTGEGAWFELGAYQGISQELVNRVQQRMLFLQSAIMNYLTVPAWGSAKPQSEFPP